MPSIRALAVGLALGLAVVVAPVAPASAQQLTRIDRPAPMSAYGSGLLWSQRDAGGAFRLMYAEEGRAPAPLPGVAPRSVPFDADLGPAGDGPFLAVYSRCATEPPYEPQQPFVDWRRARGCRLYEYDLTRGRERSLKSDGVLPAVWKGSFAYFSEGRRPTLLLRGRRGGPARTLPGGPTGRRFDLPTSIDLYGRRLAVAWRFSGRLDAPGSEILLVDTRRRTKRVVDRIGGGGLTSITREAPAFDSGRLYWARLCQGDPGGCPGRAALVRYRYAASGPAQTAPIGRYGLWQARGGGVTWLLRDDSPFRLCRDVGRPTPAATCRIFGSSALPLRGGPAKPAAGPPPRGGTGAGSVGRNPTKVNRCADHREPALLVLRLAARWKSGGYRRSPADGG